MFYAVTTVSVRGYNFPRTRLVGVFTKPEKAEYAVVNNVGDIHEGDNTYVVIEETQPDVVYPASVDDNARRWFRWDGDKTEGRYVPCEVPERFRNLIGIGVG